MPDVTIRRHNTHNEYHMTQNQSPLRRSKINMIQKLNNRKSPPTIVVSKATGEQTVPTNTVSPAKLPIMIAAWLLVAVIALIGSGLAGTAQAQAGSGAIPSITLESNEPGKLVITWATPDPTPTDYRLSWAHSSLGFLSYKNPNEAQRANLYPAAGVNTLTINDLTPGDIYKVHLRARYTSGGNNNGPWSGPWSATTTQRVKNHPPAAPTGLTASLVEHNSLTLTWNDPQDTNITGYRIQRGTDANSLHTIEPNTGGPSTNYTDSTVVAETTYHYAVLALSQDGNGARSSTSVTTLAEPGSEDPPNEQPVQNDPPAAPTGLTASSIEHDSLTLTWDDPQDDSITGYQVLRGASEDNLSTLEPDTGNASTEYTDSTAAAESTYFYAVTALSADGDGAQSSAISVTTPAEPQSEEQLVQNDPPAAPTGLTASRTSHDSLTLTWDDPQDDSITGYRILRGEAYKNLPTIEEDTRSSSPSYTDNNVGEATTYFYQAVALRADMESPKSITIEVTSPAERIRSVSGQSTTPSTQTLVSNMDRATHHMEHFIAKDLAQGFRTGPHPTGYKLSSVDLYVTGANDLTVQLVESSAGNQQTVALLIPPNRLLRGHDVYSFSTPANTTLAPNKDYWIVVKGNGNGWFHATTGEAASPARGWELADSYDYRSRYIYAEDGTQSINTDTEFRRFPGNLSLRINRLNHVATGQLTISGTPETQQTLTASAAGIDDDDGGVPPTPDYQWMRYSADGTTFETNIGTKSSEYTLVLTDEGKKIRVQTSFVDDKHNDEGPFTSDAYPASNTITAPTNYTMVSNTGQTVDPDRSVNFSAEPRSQSFTTSGETAGYILTSATILSIDPEGDEFTVKICEVESNAPTTSCTDLTPPTSFAAGQLVFNSPSDRTITLSKATTYALVFSAAGGTTVTLPATAEDNEDPISLPGWYIRNKSQFFSNNQWMDRGYDVSYLIAIKGQPTQINQASGRPAIAGNPSVGQILTATTDSITAPEGVVGNFSHQWRRLSSNGFTFETNVGANSSQYTLTPDDLDKKFQVEVRFVDTRGLVVGFPLRSPAYPTGRTISTAPSISNTSQNGNSNAPISTEVAQSFTTGQSPHGYQLSSVTIFYEDEEKRRITLKVCEASSGGSPTTECWNLKKPASFVPGPLHFTVPDTDFRIMAPHTTYAVVLKGPRPRSVKTTVDTPCPQEDPNFVESCVQEVVITVIIAAQVGVTTSDGEDPLSSQDASIRNAYQQNNEGTWQDSSSGEAIRIAVQYDTTPNRKGTGTPVVTGTARVGQVLTATVDDLDDENGLPSRFDHQWKRYSAAGVFEADIGVNSNRYTLTLSDLGKKLQVGVSYTDRSNYSEGPLASEIYPPGTTVVVTAEDDLLVANAGTPGQEETVSVTSKVAQVFTTGDNPNGYEITSVAVPGSNASIEICRFESQHDSSPGSNCIGTSSPESPVQLRKQWVYAVVLDPDGGQADVNVTDIGQDATSLPNWSIRGRYQELDQLGEWGNANGNKAIRIELHGRPRSVLEEFGQLTATPGNQQVSLEWTNWTPSHEDIIQKLQYRMKLVGGPWDPNWTDLPGSNAGTESHTLRNLTNGVEHTIQLRAVFTKEGQTLYGGAETIRTTPRAPLTAPRNLDASTEGDGGVRLSWSDPADSTLTGYQHRYRNTSDNGWNPDWTNIPGSNAATTSHILTGMAKNLRHTLEVRTLRDDDQGPAASSSVTPRGPMPRLQNLAAAADDQEVTLSWDNPGDHGITGYQYRHQTDTESQWNPNWTDVPSSNAGTTSHTVRPLVNLTAYTFEVRAMRGLEEGPASSTSATTPDGPADVPKEPRKLSVHEEDQGFTASWGKPPDEDERAPVTSYLVRHRKIGTSPWQNVTVISDECCSKTITGLTNRLHYEVQAAAVNRLGTGPWAGPVNVTPQAPATQPPAPTGDANLSLGQIGQGWETTGNNLIDSCTGTKKFQIIWNGPDGHSRKADQWAAHINTNGGAGVVSYSFNRSPGQQEYYEMNGTVHLQGAGNVGIHVRGKFGQTWGTWSRVTLHCFKQ